MAHGAGDGGGGSGAGAGGRRKAEGREWTTGGTDPRHQGGGAEGSVQKRGQGRDGEAEERGGDEREERVSVKAQGNHQRTQPGLRQTFHTCGHYHFSQWPCSTGITAPILWMRKLRFQTLRTWLKFMQVREEVAFEQGEGQRDSKSADEKHRKGQGKREEQRQRKWGMGGRG